MLPWSHSSCMSATCTAPPQGHAKQRGGQGYHIIVLSTGYWFIDSQSLRATKYFTESNMTIQKDQVCMFNTWTLITYSGVTVSITVCIHVQRVHLSSDIQNCHFGGSPWKDILVIASGDTLVVAAGKIWMIAPEDILVVAGGRCSLWKLVLIDLALHNRLTFNTH